jgi:hypothetical protein
MVRHPLRQQDNRGETRMKVITLTHYERGPMQVEVWDEATWWLRKRQWTCPDDPELGSFEDEDFDETSEQIEAALA